MPYDQFVPTNVSEVTSIHLSDYYGMESRMPVYFLLFLVIYISTVVENVLLIGLVCCEKALHEPMYVLLCNLAVNGLYGSSALLPALLHNLLSRSYDVSLPLCQTQIYAVHTYAITEFTILAAMSYDRYVAICHPLHYHKIMSRRLVMIVVLTWLYPLLAFVLVLVFTLRLRICQRTIDKLYCLNYSLVKLACTNTSVVNIVGLLSVALYTLPQLVMILYSYVRILRICALSCRESRLKALRTCAPHLLAITNYSVGCFLEIAQSRFSSSHLSHPAKLFLSLYFLIFPPMLNPAIYGLTFKVIRAQLFRLFGSRGSQPRGVPGWCTESGIRTVL